MDLRSRETPPFLWALATIISMPLAFYSYRTLSLSFVQIVISIMLSLSVTLVVYVLYKKCMMGGADVLALLFLSLCSPVLPDSIVPAPFLTIIYASIPGFIYHVYSVKLVCKDLSCFLKHRFEVPAKRLAEDPRLRWWMIVDGESSCVIDVDTPTLAASLARENPERLVKATPGHPYVTHLAIGYAIACAIKDFPILALLVTIQSLSF
ncbi:MAG: prepilin peptidase [Acidilobaceae archaeon]